MSQAQLNKIHKGGHRGERAMFDALTVGATKQERAEMREELKALRERVRLSVESCVGCKRTEPRTKPGRR